MRLILVFAKRVPRDVVARQKKSARPPPLAWRRRREDEHHKKERPPSPTCLAATRGGRQHKGDSTISRIDASMFDGWQVVVGRAGCADSSLSKRMMVGAIISAISRLSIFPDSGSPLAALYPINTGYRYVVSGNYLAFYRHMGGCVYIDRIFYSGSDWIERLFSS